MRLGIHLIPDRWDTFRRRVEVADRTGFSHIWVAESPFTVFEVFTAVTVAGLATRRVTIGPGCTNVVLRHESLVASALGSIDELVGGGRVVCAIGSGDTPVRTLGEKPSAVAQMRQAIGRLRDLTAGRRVRYHGREVSLTWARRMMPVYLAAEGPRTLEMGGEVADGIISGSGVSPEVMGWVRDRLAAGAACAGRNSAEIDVWLSCMVAVAETREKARDLMRARVANRARHNLMAAPELVPEQHRAEARRLVDNFDIARWYDPKHAGLVTDYMLDRFAVAGTVEEVIDAFRALEAAGVKALMIDLPLQTFDETLHIVGEHIIPALGTCDSPIAHSPRAGGDLRAT